MGLLCFVVLSVFAPAAVLTEAGLPDEVSMLQLEAPGGRKFVRAHSEEPEEAAARVNLGELLNASQLTFSGGVVQVTRWISGSEGQDNHRLLYAGLRLAETTGAAELRLPADAAQHLGGLGGLPERVAADSSAFRRLQAWRSESAVILEKGFGREGSMASLMKQGLLILQGGVVKLSGWNGMGLGNHIYQLEAALVFSKYVGAQSLTLPANAADPFDLPPEIALPGAPDAALQQSCEHAAGDMPGEGLGFWKMSCLRAPIEVAHTEMLNHVRPLFKQELAACAAAPDEAFENNLLTVHFRVHDRAEVAAPCSLVDKAFADGGHQNILIVSDSSSDTDPCEDYLVSKYGQKVVLQKSRTSAEPDGSKRLLADFCALVRAQNLKLSWSTFPEGAAMLSTRLRRLYHSNGFQRFGTQSVDWCPNAQGQLWSGAELFHYDLGDYAKIPLPHDPAGLEAAKSTYLSYPASQITLQKPPDCTWPQTQG